MIQFLVSQNNIINKCETHFTNILNFNSLEVRRLRSDVILCWKHFKNLISINSCDHFKIFTPNFIITRFVGATREFSTVARLPSLTTFYHHINLILTETKFSIYHNIEQWKNLTSKISNVWFWNLKSKTLTRETFDRQSLLLMYERTCAKITLPKIDRFVALSKMKSISESSTLKAKVEYVQDFTEM